MGYEEFEDGDIRAWRDDVWLEIDEWNGSETVSMKIEQAQRLFAWLKRVLPEN